jgi:hypothetical protein
MPPHVLYQIPMATGTLRLVMIGVCLLFVGPIYGWWLPRAIKFLRDKSRPVNTVSVVILLFPALIAVGPLLVLVALITNPTTVVTQTGITYESAFRKEPVSFAWNEIDHVDCHTGRSGQRLNSITIVGPGGKRIDIGNASGVDIYSIRELMQNQLGAAAMHHCKQPRPQQ